jgi:hypothetical protein
MAVDIDRLLKQDVLSFSPVSGAFDIDDLAEGIATIDYSFRDEDRPDRFVLAPEAETRDQIAAARRADPTSPFPSVLNLEAHPDAILLWPVTYQPELRDLSKRVIEWLLATYTCTVENDFGTPLGGSE